MNVPSWLLPFFQQAQQQTGVPAALLEAQDQAESSFNPNAISPSGAEGIAQFLPSTAAGFGINPWDPQQAIAAQAKYDAQLYQQTGSWVDALTAYSGGANPSTYADPIITAAEGVLGQGQQSLAGLLQQVPAPGLATIPAPPSLGGVGRGLAGAATATTQNVGIWARNNIVALVVALVVALALFGGKPHGS